MKLSLVHAMDASAGEAQAFGQVITKYMKHRSLPLHLQEKIFGFFVHMHSTGDDLDEMKVLQNQPRFVRQKLLEEICFRAMKISFKPLHNYSDGFLRSITHGMTPYLALPKEILIAQNQVCDKIYLIIRGKVNILTSSRDKFLVTDTIQKDAIVGDFQETDSTYRALTYCELYCLTLEHFDSCLHYSRNNDESCKLTDKQVRNKMKLSIKASNGADQFSATFIKKHKSRILNKFGRQFDRVKSHKFSKRYADGLSRGQIWVIHIIFRSTKSGVPAYLTLTNANTTFAEITQLQRRPKRKHKRFFDIFR